MRVGDICGRDVVTVMVSDTVVAAAQQIQEHRSIAAVIVEPGGDDPIPVGVITRGDLVGVIARSPEHIDRLLVEDIVFHPLVTVEEDVTTWRALQRMRDRGVRQMPVVDEAGILVGIVTIDDFVVHIGEMLGGLSRIITAQSGRDAAI
ncbi:MAG: CBS domain-containing protein [Myxococcota bacterium]